MKKIYVLTLALGVTAAAMAGVTGQKSALSSSTLPAKSDISFAKQSDLKMDRVTPSVLSDITSIESIGGTYDFSFSWLLNSSQPAYDVTIKVTDAATGECTIEFGQWVVIGVVDMSSKTLSIANKQIIGEDEDGDIYFYLKPVSSSGQLESGASTAAASVGTISGNTITFPELDVWAIGNPDLENLGYYFLSYTNVLEKQETVDPMIGWTTVGTAKLVDGWVVTCFGLDQYENEWEVDLQQNDNNSMVYRLVDPYKNENCPVAQYNESTKMGFIEFDVTNPDRVLFNPVEAGFARSNLGITKMYCMNTLTFAIGYTGLTEDELLAQNPDLVLTTYKDGVIELKSEYNSTTGGYKNDACFGIQGDIYGGYGWQDNNKVSINMGARITLNLTPNSVAGIYSDNDAPVVYYNLQGLRVDNPAKGQVVIARQGSKATKFVVK